MERLLKTMAKSRPSSQLVEFFIAIGVGLLAILGGLLCVGFLLVEPVRNPMGIGETQPLPGTHITSVRNMHVGNTIIILTS